MSGFISSRTFPYFCDIFPANRDLADHRKSAGEIPSQTSGINPNVAGGFG